MLAPVLCVQQSALVFACPRRQTTACAGGSVATFGAPSRACPNVCVCSRDHKSACTICCPLARPIPSRCFTLAASAGRPRRHSNCPNLNHSEQASKSRLISYSFPGHCVPSGVSWPCTSVCARASHAFVCEAKVKHSSLLSLSLSLSLPRTATAIAETRLGHQTKAPNHDDCMNWLRWNFIASPRARPADSCHLFHSFRLCALQRHCCK